MFVQESTAKSIAATIKSNAVTETFTPPAPPPTINKQGTVVVLFDESYNVVREELNGSLATYQKDTRLEFPLDFEFPSSIPPPETPEISDDEDNSDDDDDKKEDDDANGKAKKDSESPPDNDGENADKKSNNNAEDGNNESQPAGSESNSVANINCESDEESTNEPKKPPFRKIELPSSGDSFCLVENEQGIANTTVRYELYVRVQAWSKKGNCPVVVDFLAPLMFQGGSSSNVDYFADFDKSVESFTFGLGLRAPRLNGSPSTSRSASGSSLSSGSLKISKMLRKLSVSEKDGFKFGSSTSNGGNKGKTEEKVPKSSQPQSTELIVSCSLPRELSVYDLIGDIELTFEIPEMCMRQLEHDTRDDISTPW
ncbi:unnamed protein product [Ambrosiozyma monospora]|uniref:Unnamed protein product n=1 Tax=Ambrosiozyma monospora TaxID=43982 RepID=A0ACB5TBL2_AMBMO|nr:unnamed protein product [Ambrosiozyma monospora]